MLTLTLTLGLIPMPSNPDVMEFILDHYENPRNHGALFPATMVMRGGNPGCGDIVTLYLRIHPETQVIEELRFTGEGCTISQAAASLTTEQLQGQTVVAARALQEADLLAELGEGVMRSRRRCATLALHTLRAALTQYLTHTGASPEPSSEAPGMGLRFETLEGTNHA